MIVFNGELYNYRELYAEYFQDDRSVNGNSDTAVLLSLYERFNKDCVKLLNGMFSFVIIDILRKSIFMCRDRFGEKPLYWMQNGQSVLFGSELKALKVLMPNCPWRIDPESVALYHMIGTIPPPHTIYEGVMALRPGHWIEVESSGKISEGQYWSIEESLNAPGENGTGTYQQILEETRTLLLQAVRSRMVSDVEVGLFLSGGHDSGAILSLIKALDLDPIRTLCLDFPDESFSEFRLARLTSQRFNANLRRRVISPQMFLDGIGDYFDSMDQPTSDGYNTFFVSRAARELGIKVWLSGVGGDELFGGYPFFKRVQTLKWMAWAISALLPRIAVEWTAPHLFEHLRVARLCHLADDGSSVTRAYQTCRNSLPWRNAFRLLAPGIRENIHEINHKKDQLYPNTDQFSDDFQRATVLETSVYMRSQLLRDMDNFSMAHSIEIRAPYLDHRLFEHVLRLPQCYKKQKGRVKPLLEDALPFALPEEVRQQGKRGFTFPVEVWLKRELAESFEEYAISKENASFCDLEIVKKLWKGYRIGTVGWGAIWSLYAFARWVRDHHESL